MAVGRDLAQLGRLLLLGLLVGGACWPLNLIDAAQGNLLRLLPGAGGGGWSGAGLALAMAPVALLPGLLWLQWGPWSSGAGSGIPQTMNAIESPEATHSLLTHGPTGARLGLWTLTTLLLPLGREGPVVQLGATVAATLRRRPGGGLQQPPDGGPVRHGGATRRFQPRLLWPSLLVCAAGALVSNLGGVPLFPLGLVSTQVAEWRQLAWGLPVGVLARLLAPALVLAAGIPGGLIDPSLALGGLTGGGLLELLGGERALGVAMGMGGTLAGATQLPLITAVFTLGLAGDQQWLLGIVLSSAVGAHDGRRLQVVPIYHALSERSQRAPRR
jgi:H+/Cl- antiporter ClcA